MMWRSVHAYIRASEDTRAPWISAAVRCVWIPREGDMPCAEGGKGRQLPRRAG